ncbi:MAG: hypothetical protein IKI29_00795 [Clostridia bacterium]|nr:hypothetical protein [Clostridia bacterium]
MLKALLKKQFLELNTFYFVNRKTGKNRSLVGIIGMILLGLLLFASVGAIFFFVAFSLAEPFAAAGMDWLFFSIVYLLAIVFGVFGSVFNTYSGLYLAKDNELLLSMPVRPSAILLSRMLTVYLTGLLYESLVLVPAYIAYWITAKVSVLAIVCQILLIFILAFVIATLTCALGWLVALIATRIKHKSLGTIVFTLLFLVGYYYVYFRFNALLQSLIVNSIKVGKIIHNGAYPIYVMGQAGTGNLIATVSVTLCAFALMIGTYLILSKTFLTVALRQNASSVKATFKSGDIKSSGVDTALFRKELKRLGASPIYIMNSALGTLLMPFAGVAAIIFSKKIAGVLQILPVSQDFVQILLAAIVCFGVSVNTLTAPSVSLEGKNIWILQTMPVAGERVLAAKQRLHLILTVPPAMMMAFCLAFVVGLDAYVFSLLLFVVIYVCFTSAVGLWLGVKFANLSWTNETVPVKQSFAVTISIFGGWAVAVLLGVAGYFALKYLTALDAAKFLLIVSVILAVATRAINRLVKTKGAKIFETLS